MRGGRREGGARPPNGKRKRKNCRRRSKGFSSPFTASWPVSFSLVGRSVGGWVLRRSVRGGALKRCRGSRGRERTDSRCVRAALAKEFDNHIGLLDPLKPRFGCIFFLKKCDGFFFKFLSSKSAISRRTGARAWRRDSRKGSKAAPGQGNSFPPPLFPLHGR